MERLAFAILKLLLKLTWILFKFALRLVLFAWSGDWHKLDKIEAQLREAVAQAKKGTPVPRQHRSPRAKPAAPQAEAGWPFEFAPELIELEPEGELQGGEATVSQPTKPRRRSAPRTPPPRPELPLALALRDPKLVRDAMVLTAVLGPRTRRDRLR